MPSGNPLGELPSLLSESSGILWHVTYIQTTRSGDWSNKMTVPYTLLNKQDVPCSLAPLGLLRVDIWGDSFAIIIE